MLWSKLKEPIYEKWKTYWFSIHPREIAEYSWEYLFTGGKEIRANLFCELWQYLSPDSEIYAELAFAIECIHVASLVIDDTPSMDNAIERRKKKTLHVILSEKKALLISFEIMEMVRMIWIANKPPHIDADDWYNFIVIKLQLLTLGQLYDIQQSGTLKELASLKTGTLFELVTETVAICIELDRPFWKIWGNNLGILFQWTDDWFDQKEDALQENRNAFNESYDTTMYDYKYIWNKLQLSIGEYWFTIPFGNYIYRYFSEIVSTNDIPSVFNLNDINVYIDYDDLLFTHQSMPVQRTSVRQLINKYKNGITKKEIVKLTSAKRNRKIISGKQIVSCILKLSMIMKDKELTKMLKTDLWNIDETEWQYVPEIVEFKRHIDDIEIEL
jgi:hypothetical protein